MEPDIEKSGTQGMVSDKVEGDKNKHSEVWESGDEKIFVNIGDDGLEAEGMNFPPQDVFSYKLSAVPDKTRLGYD